MLRDFLKNKKAQNTAEYALLIALVVAGVIAMQTYAQRALQARVHDAAVYMAGNGEIPGGGTIGNSTQYEPYYLNSDYNSSSNSSEDKRLGEGLVAQESESNRQRNGYQATTYNGGGDSSGNDSNL